MDANISNVSNVAVEAQSFAQRAKDFFQVDRLMESFDFSTSNLIKMGAYATIGFLLGFLLKKYGRSLIMALSVFAVLLYALSYVSVVTIHWDQARELIGLTAQDSFDSVLHALWASIQKQVVHVVCGLIGFIIGYKVA